MCALGNVELIIEYNKSSDNVEVSIWTVNSLVTHLSREIDYDFWGFILSYITFFLKYHKCISYQVYFFHFRKVSS